MTNKNLNVVVTVTDKASAKLKGVTGTVSKLKSALIGVGAALALKNIIKTTSDWEKGLANVSTLLDKKTLPALASMEKGLMKIGRETGTSLNELTEGLFFVVSAGVEAANSVEFLADANKLSIAGATSNATAIKALVGTMKAYGKESLTAAELSDLLFTINKKGFTTFEEIANVMPKVASSANLVGVSQRELAAAMATLVGATGNADEVSTQLNATFVALEKPSKAMSAALSKMGFESGFAAVKAIGLEETLAGLRETAGGTDEGMSSLFNNIRALKGAIPLAGALAEKFTENQKEMAEAVGATDVAFAKQMETFDVTLKRAMVTLDTFKIRIGTPLLEVLDSSMKGWMMFADVVDDVSNWFTATAGPRIDAFFDGIFEAIAYLRNKWNDDFLFLKTWITLIFDLIVNTVKTAFGILKGLFDFWLGVFTLDWEKSWEGIKEVFSSIWEGIKGIATAAMDFIVGGILSLIEKVKSAISALKQLAGLQGSTRTDTDLLTNSSRARLQEIEGRRAAGGSVRGGGAFLVGEQGPEIFTPSVGGMITPNNKLGGVTVNINGGTYLSEEVAEQIGNMIVNRLNMHGAT